LEAAVIEIKDLKHKLNHSSHYTILSPPCEACVSLKSKFFRATKENTKLQQEVAYLTTHLEKTILSEKMIEQDLSRIKECTTKFTYKLGIEFERCEKKVGRVFLSSFLAPAIIRKRRHSNQPKPLPIQSKVILQPQERSEERISQVKRGSFYFYVLWPCWSLG
jgi:hypothetical protein